MKREFVKSSVKDLKAYVPEPQSAEAILNANENPYNLPKDIRDKITEAIGEINFNRYPDPVATELVKSFSEMVDMPTEQIIAGNGLDEILSILINTFVEPGEAVVTHVPGFSMYKIWTDIANGEFYEVEDKPGHIINIAGLEEEAIRNNAKLIFICSPNNPTGAKVTRSELKDLLESSPSLVVLDEAYIDFDKESLVDLVNAYDNLIVLRTMSKAFRTPSARCGFAIGPVDIIENMKKVKAPYNLNTLTQTAAKIVIDNRDQLEPVIDEIVSARGKMFKFLENIDGIEVFPSTANFIYIKTDKDKELQNAFLNKDVLVRYFPEDQAFRITIGTPSENALVQEAIKEVF